jgi:hypothetical protein
VVTPATATSSSSMACTGAAFAGVTARVVEVTVTGSPTAPGHESRAWDPSPRATAKALRRRTTSASFAQAFPPQAGSRWWSLPQLHPQARRRLGRWRHGPCAFWGATRTRTQIILTCLHKPLVLEMFSGILRRNHLQAADLFWLNQLISLHKCNVAMLACNVAVIHCDSKVLFFWF